MNKVIAQIKKNAYSRAIPTGHTRDDINFLINQYNNSDALMCLLQQTENSLLDNRNVNLKFQYQISYNYNSSSGLDSIFVIDNNNSSLIYVWDLYILEMTHKSWHEYLDKQEDELQNKFNLQNALKKLQSIQYIISILSYNINDINKKYIVYDRVISRKELENLNTRIYFDEALQINSQYSRITDKNMISKLISKLTFNLY